MNLMAKMRREQQDRESRKAANLAGLLTPSQNRGTYRGTVSGPAPKPEAQRNPALLEMARGRPCLLMVPAVCSHRVDTTVAAHSNHQAHGKSMGRKADDCYVVEACAACHYWLDFGKAPASQKLAVFMNGHALQVLSWRLRATDPAEPERARKAYRWALEKLNATPIGEL